MSQEAAPAPITVERPVVWVSNIPTPYRWPVYEELARRVQLRVRHLAPTEPGREWTLAAPNFDERVLRARRIWSRNERYVYLLLEAPHRIVSPGELLVLGPWESPAMWQLLASARRRGIPTIGFYGSTESTHGFRHGPVARARGLFYRSVDAVLTYGHAATRSALSFGVPPSRVVTGFNTVDVAAFHEAGMSAGASDGRGGGHRFLYVGQLINRKGLDIALRAFAAMRAEGDTFVIAGSGPLRSELEGLAASLGTRGSVEFAGFVQGPALLQLYASAHTLVLSSLEEVWGLVVNEALAAGLHAVVTRQSGVASSVEHMRGVYLCEADAASMSAAMVASRGAWRGRIAEPEILAYTPGFLAERALEAFAVAEWARASSR